MRIAELVSHQNFERNLRFLVKHVCWSVCFIPTDLSKGSGAGCRKQETSNLSCLSHAQMKHHFPEKKESFTTFFPSPNMTWNNFFITEKENTHSCDVILHQIFLRRVHPRVIWNRTSNQARLPAEFKHINKRRKRN